MPENTTLVDGSLKVPSGFNTDGTTSTDIHVAYDGNPNYLADKGTIDNPTVEKITFKVKVNPNSDWSDYYNSETRSGKSEMMISNQNGQVDANSYLVIPNTAVMSSRGLDALSSDDKADKTESIATFNMGLQMFAVKQYIVQDDDTFNGATKLDPSHYVDTTRNDKTAVTTAVKVQMPNYLKIDKLTAGAMQNIKEAGFDEGKHSWVKASDDVVLKPENLANPDLTNSTSELPSNLQGTSGKTYYYITKWSPKTKYYQDFAKLDHMQAHFDGQAILSAHSKGDRDTDDQAPNDYGPEKITDKKLTTNETMVHLPNIYSYMTLSDRGYQHDDGQKLDYTLYGQVKGLAVDSSNKTNFSKEGQPIKAWIRTKDNSYDGSYHTLTLKDGLGTGDVGDVVETWKDLSSDPLTNKDITTGYWSISNTYRTNQTYATEKPALASKNPALAEVKGHSVVLTNNIPSESLTDKRTTDLKWEAWKKQRITAGDKTYTNARVFIDYYNYDKDKSLKYNSLTRILRES
ncbi:hypothetical protein [Lactobacillus sp.]|uniref:hypothetical protein n=1 Tax=Lactobacillus sp. TaxID=1591 RepID=UPI001987F12B|nr:hypothetical protein [Lactobacillus sp.]MBD5429239.1 hypothetical protein [Lactobacillus sp.]